MVDPNGSFEFEALKKCNKEELIKMIIDQKATIYDDDIEDELMRDLITRYVEATKKLNEKLEEIRLLSIIDPLTKVYNRQHFNDAFQKEFLRYQRYGKVFSIIMFDIDHFKRVNDNYGHNVGDNVLVKVTQLVKDTIRSVDVLARWGGEEFIIIVLGSELDQAVILAERLRHVIDTYKFDDVNHITCSFGVSQVLTDDTIATTTKRVDVALYNAKEGGRNRVCYQKVG